MGYAVEPISSDPELLEEASAFLAAFAASDDGSKDPADRESATWKNRFAWWWDHNPYCHADSPRGFLLRKECGAIGGFFGFIPHDYILGGERVPSLISTTTFVRSGCRDAALGLFIRAHRLREKYHLVDGGPNKVAQALLERTGYQHAERSKVYLFPIRRRSLHPGSWLLQAARLATPRPLGTLGTGKMVTSLDAVRSIPEIRDCRIRKHIDRETLTWYLNSGSKTKHFVGWCDGDGTLQAYLVGFLRRRFGMAVFVINEAASFDPLEDERVGALVSHVSAHPDEANLPGDADLIAWPTEGRNARGTFPFAINYDSKLFYRLPSHWADAERLCQPLEGDKALL